MSLWKFGRREPACNVCETAFEDGEKIWSRLRLAEEGLARQDVCWRCWQEPAAEGEIDVFWWRTRHTVGKKKGLSLNLPALEALFHSIDGREEPTIRELRYLLCLLLMRKRRLKLERVVREGDREEMICSRPKREERYHGAVYDFSPDRIDELRTQLAEVFEGFDPEEDEPTAQAEEPDEPELEDSDAEACEPA